MWVIQCDNGSLDGRRIWLKPNKTYLFGRSRRDNPPRRFQVDNNTISRHHLTLKVAAISPGDGLNIHRNTTLELKDENSRGGTEIDGVKFHGESRILTQDAHTLRLGPSKEIFRLKWVPIVLTFSTSGKDVSTGNDPLTIQQRRLEDAGLDIKLVPAYLPNVTTHVVANKRNTAKGLSALLHGTYIVSEGYIDALVAAATTGDLDREEEVSLLEDDFDKNWPDASRYLPDKSKEPTERPAADFLPNPARRSVFEGYTFVFCDQVQFETLQPPITQGGGKALHCKTQPGHTTSQEVVAYVKRAAGETGLGEFENGSTGRGVVVVKFRQKGRHADWAALLDFEIAQALDHRLIEQNEFLDAILRNDASTLRRPLLPAEPTSNREGPIRSSGQDTQTTNGPNSRMVLKRKREPIVSRFKGFDDDDDDDKMDLAAAKSALAGPKNSSRVGDASSSSKFVSFVDSDTADNTGQPSKTTQTAGHHKRPDPAPGSRNDEDVMDEILPSHTARKRQKLALDAQREHDAFFEDDVRSNGPTSSKPPHRFHKAPPIDVKDIVRQRRYNDQDASDDEGQDIHAVIEGMTVEQMQSLAVVEEMQIPKHQRPSKRANNRAATPSDRWNDAWNGRKNFKKFRRQGNGGASRRGNQRVIVSLEEAKVKHYGIGESYWVDDHDEETETVRRRREKKTRGAQSQSQSQTQPKSSDSHVVSVPSELVTESGGVNGSSVIDLDAPRTTRRQERTQQTDSSGRSRMSAENTSQVLAEKRGARNQVVQPHSILGGPRKRKKFAAARDSDASGTEDDDDDDGSGRFKFSRRFR